MQPLFNSPHAYTPKYLAEKILTSRSALEGERKQVTVLFCDIANSTALADRIGAEAMHALLNRFFEIALNEVHAYEGTVNQFLGDGFMALFGAPVAHEDHPRRAALAALAIQRAVREWRADLDHLPKLAMSVRIGLNTGIVIVGKIGDNLRMDYTAVGDTTNLASRLQHIAEPGSVCLSESMHRAVADHFECRRLGEHNVKGKTAPVAVFELVGPRTPRSQWDHRGIASPLVGREPELATLTECFEGLLAGHGRVVSVIGEAGLGKSRLIAEVRRRFTDRGLLWLEGRALAYGQTVSYWPFLEIIRTYAGIHDDDRPESNWSKLEHCVTALFPDQVAEILPYLATLLALEVRAPFADRVKFLDSKALGGQVFRASRRFFERLGQRCPVVIVFEDLHWMDQSSTELLEHLFPLVETVPLLLCGISRPENTAPAARLQQTVAAKTGGRYTELRLTQLSDADSAQLVRNLLNLDGLSPQLRALILAKAEGNPFFLEEVVRSLIALGALERDADTGIWRPTDRARQVTVPDTIQGVIMARIDRLSDEVKYVLRIAAVIGRSFFYRVLRAVIEPQLDIDTSLGELQRLELIREKRRFPELEYVFRHALVQGTTYESILTQQRGRLHRQVADCIENLFADRLEEFYGLLAYHYARAEDWAKAQTYLVKAGDQAGRIAADAEALAHYRQALITYERAFGDRWDPLHRATLERKMGEALFCRGDHQEATEYFERALAYLGTSYPRSRSALRTRILCQLLLQACHRVFPHIFLRKTEKPTGLVDEERARLYLVMGWIDYFRDQERFLLDVLLSLNSCERSGFSDGAAHGCSGFGIICDAVPSLVRLAPKYHARAIVLAERTRHPVTIGLAYLGVTIHEYYSGRWSNALQYAVRSVAAYREAGELRQQGALIDFLGTLHAYRGEYSLLGDYAHELCQVGQDAADSHVMGWGLRLKGLLESRTGRLDRAAEAFREAIELFKSIPAYPSMAEAMGDLAQCYIFMGNPRRGIRLLEDCHHLIGLHRLRGHQLTSPRNALAEAYLNEVDQTTGSLRATGLKMAKRACDAAVNQGAIFRGGQPHAWRVSGSVYWLRGKETAARACWRRSLSVAEHLGAKYEVAMTRIEIGKRLCDQQELQLGGDILADIEGSFKRESAS